MTTIRHITTGGAEVWRYICNICAVPTTATAAREIIERWHTSGKDIGYCHATDGSVEEWYYCDD